MFFEMFHKDTKTIITEDNARNYISRLRFQVIAPIAGTILLAVVIIATYAYYHEKEYLDDEVIHLRTTAADLYQNSIRNNVDALRTIMDVLKTDREIQMTLKNRNHQKLLQLAGPIYENINRHFGITHFYFTGPDRINILRVHKPEKFGDLIDRRTTVLARKGGMDAYGVELGPLGTLTLRYVQPWYDRNTQKLIGFVELGMEVDETIHAIHELFDLDIFVLIYKKNLRRADWEDGMRTFGKAPDWDQFTNVVLSVHGQNRIPSSLFPLINEMDVNKQSPVFKKLNKGSEKRAIFQPLHDVSGNHVGMLVMLLDISHKVEKVKKSILTGATHWLPLPVF